MKITERELKNLLREYFKVSFVEDTPENKKKKMLKDLSKILTLKEEDSFEIEDWESSFAKVSKPTKFTGLRKKKGASAAGSEAGKLPSKIADTISNMSKKYGIEIDQEHIDLEYKIEKNHRNDAGKEDAQALAKIRQLVAAAKKQFPELKNVKGIVSGHRSYDDQARNFGRKAKTRGVEDTQKSNTLPGFSEHHTGKAFDIFSVENAWWDKRSKIKDWVSKNSAKFGFRQTYKGATARTEEPWHLYYTG